MQAQDSREYTRRAKTPGVCAEVAEAQSPGVSRDSEFSPWYNAKYSPIQENQGSQQVYWINGEPGTGEIVPFVQEETNLKKRYEPGEVRLERFALQSAARRLLPGSRTSKCLWLRQFNQSMVELWKSKQHGTVHYKNLQTCKSPWACPVCAACISERRRLQLLKIMEQHRALGGDCYLLTLTIPHTIRDDLGAMLKGLAKAMSRFNSMRSAVSLWDEIDTAGTVRAFEVTHGENGWHPHFHILILCRSGLDLAAYKARFFSEWSNACRLAKLPAPSEAHGVKLDNGTKAGAYVSKGLWGLESEMTKGHVKKSRKGRSPFDLLRSYLYDDDKQAGALFREYAAAFKGKRQLVYSKGLEALYDIEELSDDDIINQTEDSLYLLGALDSEQWRVIRQFNMRGEILELARHGLEPVMDLIASLQEQDKKLKREKDKKVEKC